jgi:hypothetical protein
MLSMTCWRGKEKRKNTSVELEGKESDREGEKTKERGMRMKMEETD